MAEAVTALAARLTQQASTTPLTPKEQLVIRLNQQYPADVGVLSVFFLNYIQLPAGQSIALPANVPHAYVSGQLVECMATSDNVIRAGLTPKVCGGVEIVLPRWLNTPHPRNQTAPGHGCVVCKPHLRTGHPRHPQGNPH